MRMRIASPFLRLFGKGFKTRTTHDCAACGMPIADSLRRLGSVRCHDCRDTDAPISPKPGATTVTRERPGTAWLS
jgi:hypothetical protein